MVRLLREEEVEVDRCRYSGSHGKEYKDVVTPLPADRRRQAADVNLDDLSETWSGLVGGTLATARITPTHCTCETK